MALLTTEDIRRLRRRLDQGGVAVIPTDTVYGLACAPEDTGAVRRLYALKGRPPDKPAAVLFFTLTEALGALPELGPRTRGALTRLLPGALTVVLANPGGHYPAAGGLDPPTLGLRVPALGATPALAALAAVTGPVLQSSANHAGGADARRLSDIPPDIRAGADIVIDAGELPGTPSTVVDLRGFEDDGAWCVLRAGALAPAELELALEGI